MIKLLKIGTLDLGGYPAHIYHDGEGHRLFVDERVDSNAMRRFEQGGQFPKVLEIDTLADRLDALINRAAEIFKEPEPSPCKECGAPVTVTPYDIQDHHECTECNWYLFIRREGELA